jgi:voltage-gated potassium channel
MPYLSRFYKVFYSHLSRMTWEMLLLMVTVHCVGTLIAMRTFETGEITELDHFIYFYMTTVTTIGYGDITPKTEAGRLAVAIWLQPGGIFLFTVVIARFAQWISTTWRKRMRGEASYEDLTDHIVIMGWGTRTQRMVDEMAGDKRREHRELVLCAKQEIENPLPERVKFVRDVSLASASLIKRSGIAGAHAIIILGADDSETLAAGLAASAANRGAHLVAYFDEESFAHLLRAHCPNCEAIASVHAELLVRAASDPGASRVVKDLVSTAEAPFQISLIVPSHAKPTRYLDLLLRFKERYNATLIGVASDTRTEHIALNAPNDRMVKAGEILYLIAPERLHAAEVAWTA